jgi:hypothetical protein
MLAACTALFLFGCPERRESCLVATAPAGGLPLLLRIGSKPTVAPKAPDKPLCTSQRELRFECEAIDDLSGLLGNGVVCGPGGVDRQFVCPKFDKRITRRPQAANAKKPCGDQACDNVEIALDEGGDTTTHLTFYDDPACHVGPPEPECRAAVHQCYYRLLSVTVNLRGTIN